MSQKITSPQELVKLRDATRSSLDVRGGDKEIRITVHMGTCGIAAGARDVMAELVSGLDARGITNVTLRQSGCIGLCDKEPMMTLTDKAGRDFLYVDLTKDKVKRIVAEHLSAGKPVDAFVMEDEGRPARRGAGAAQAGGRGAAATGKERSAK
jgi:NADP-reducing hydrogenase subunit HndB